MIRWDIRQRLLFLALLPAALIALLLALHFTHSRIHDLDHSLRDHGRHMAAILAPACEYGVISGNREPLLPLLRNIAHYREVGAVTVRDRDGTVLVTVRNDRPVAPRGVLERIAAWHSNLPETLTFESEIRQTEVVLDELEELGGATAAERSADLVVGGRGEVIGWVTVEVTTAPTVARQLGVAADSLLITLAGLLVAGFIAIRAAGQVSRPILQLTDAVRQLERGDLSVRVGGDGVGEGRELATLRQGIDAMAASLENSREEMQHHIDDATRELRETIEAVEMQNVELDIARKRALEASKVKSEFLSSMSHEIRTPMNGIIGFSNLLLRTPLNDTQQDYVQTINESATNLLAIINDILDFSRIESGRLQLETVPFDLREVIDDALVLLAPLAYDKGLELIRLIYSDVPVRLLGDPVRVRQVLTNLAGNAVKFTHDGSVAVRAMVESEDVRHVQLRITVTDTGVGIPAGRGKGLFDAFTQVDSSVSRNFGGTGLGLAISKRLVQNMQGEIGVESREGEGSTFWFTLRCERQEEMEGEASPRIGELGSALLHDSHRLARTALGHLLSGWGIETREVEEWSAIGERLKEGEREGERAPALVVCGLPADGAVVDLLRERIEQWRSIRSGLRVALLVNTIDQRTQERLYEAGADLVMPKITRHDALRREIRQLMGAGRPAEVAVSTPAAVVAERESRGRFAGLRVLVVDDNQINLILTSTLLREQGITVVQATSGEEAVAEAGRRRFDLILMDILMPGISGVEATREIRLREPREQHTPIVAVTAHALPSERENFLQAGLDDCLVKPLREEELWRMVQHWVIALRGGREEAPGGPGELPHPVGEGEPLVYDAELALKLAGGNRKLADRLLGMLLRDLDRRRREIHAAFADGDEEPLHQRVHKLHGSAANCSTAALQHAARTFEVLLSEGVEEGREAALAALDHEVDRLLELAESRELERDEEPEPVE